MVMTREEQRTRDTRKLMTSVQLHCHLSNLIREILAGDTTKLVEFQQFVQYAPAGMRDDLLAKIEAG